MSLYTAAKNALYSIDGHTHENIYMSLYTAAKNALHSIDAKTFKRKYKHVTKLSYDILNVNL